MLKYKIGDTFLYKIEPEYYLRQIIDIIDSKYYVMEGEGAKGRFHVTEFFIDTEYFKLDKLSKLLYV